MADLQALAAAVIKGDRNTTEQITRQALEEKVAPEEILNKGLVAGMSVIGEKFKKNEVFVPEVLIAARAMKSGLAVLEPELKATGVKPAGTVVIGTVKGDLHDIGKNLVAMLMQGAGLQVVDLGIDVTPEKFVEQAKANGAQIIAMSALLTTTMPQMADVVKAVKDSGLSIKTMIGGAPVTQAYADEIGAHGYAADAASAATLALDMVKA